MSSPQSSKSPPSELLAVLPESLRKFISAGKKEIEADDGDWTVEVEMPPSYVAKSLPSGAVLIAANGLGDHLFLTPETTNSAAFSRKVHAYWHEEGPGIDVFAEDLDLLLNPPPPAVTQRPAVLYSDGQTPVQLGDEVTARDFFIRRQARVIYVPGISKKNRDMEHHGLCWVSLKFAKGVRIGTLVDPKTSRLSKSVRFVKRCSDATEEMGPGDRFE
jgi:hypothetical protein